MKNSASTRADKSNLKSKKRIIIAVVIIVAALILLYALTVILPILFNNANNENSDATETIDFEWYPADYEEDIFADEDYLKLISNGILRYKSENSITVVNENEAHLYGDAAEVMIHMFYSILKGDADTYNSLFSEQYLANNKPMPSFTKQKLYNARIEIFSYEQIEEKNGNNYTKYTFKIEYNIFENNGTFRKDMAEDARAQFVEVTDRDGKYLIDSIFYSRYK